MSDNIFSAVLTFGLMAAGTIAVGSELMGSPRTAAAAPTAGVTLDPVIVTGRRASADAVTLPMVVVTGHRGAWAQVAVESHDEGATKVE